MVKTDGISILDILSQLARHRIACGKRLHELGENASAEDEQAFYNHPLLDACEWISENTGIPPHVAQEMAERWHTPYKLNALKERRHRDGRVIRAALEDLNQYRPQLASISVHDLVTFLMSCYPTLVRDICELSRLNDQFNKSSWEAAQRERVAVTCGTQDADEEAHRQDALTNSACQVGERGEGSNGDENKVRGKRSTSKGEAQEKLIAALTKHHKYADGGCLNLEPVGNNELARLADVSESTASAFFKKHFHGHAKYRALCSDKQRLITSLKLLNQEYSPHLLYGMQPPGEYQREDEY